MRIIGLEGMQGRSYIIDLRGGKGTYQQAAKKGEESCVHCATCLDEIRWDPRRRACQSLAVVAFTQGVHYKERVEKENSSPLAKNFLFHSGY